MKNRIHIFIFLLCGMIFSQGMDGYAQPKAPQQSPQKSTTSTGNSSSKPKPKTNTSTLPKTPSVKKKGGSGGGSGNKSGGKSGGKENINSLKNQQSKVQAEMKKLDESISQTQLTTKQTLQEIKRLNSDIDVRSQLIKQQNKEISQLSQEIVSMNTKLERMKAECNAMKKQYVDLIYHAYLKKNSHNRLLFILSASSFQESYRRFLYLQQLASLRKQQAKDIEAAQLKLTAQKNEINKAKTASEKIKSEKEREQNRLLAEKNKQNQLVASLQKKEAELKKELADRQKIVEQLNKKIEDLIAKEAREAEKRKQTQPSVKGGYAMTVEEKALSGSFEKNRGALPWPVKGQITGHFGMQPHPVLKNIVTNNKGIYITASKGSEASSVFDGVVTQCFSVPGSNNAVIIRHGNYLTVYANLTNIYVKAGDKIARNNKIGKIYEDAEDSHKATLLFQVWKEKDLLNPEIWIRK